MTHPDSWDMQTVDHLCALVTSGGTPSRSHPEYFHQGTIPWVKTGELSDSYIGVTEESITLAAVDASSAKVLPADTVLMAMYGATVGALGMLRGPSSCNQASCAMIADPQRCDSRWLFYALLNDRSRIVSLATGAAQQNLSGKTIRQFAYPTPPVQEQRAIAEVLGALDDKIAANSRTLSLTDQLVRAKYSALKDSAPCARQLGELAVNVRQKARRGSVPDDFVYVGLEHVPRRKMWLDAHGRADSVTSDKWVFKTGDVLFGKLRPYFHKVAYAPSEGICSTDVLVVRAKDPLFAGIVLAAASDDETIALTTSATEGTRMPRTNWRDLASVELPWSDQSVVAKLSSEVVSFASHAAAVNRQSTALANTRDALLPLLMSGKVRVKDAESVVGEVL